MSRTPPRFPLLIAISLLTAGIAVAGTSTSLADEASNASEGAEASSTTVVREEPQEGPRNLTLAGQLTNASSGDPAPDVQLDIFNTWTDEDGDAKSRESFTVTTDEDGSYALNVSKGMLGIRIDDPRFQQTRVELEIDEDAELDIPMEPVSSDLARIQGTVTSDGGEPIEDAHVRVSAMPEACEDAADCDEASHRQTESAGSEASGREAETGQGSAHITYQPRHDRYASTETDEDGSYEVRVLPDTYQVHVRAEDHLSERTSVEAPEGGMAEADVSLTPIPPASVTLEGQIVDEATGEPIERAEIRVDNQRWGTHASIQADEDGTFELAVEPGYAIVQIRAEESYYVPCEEPDRTEEDDGMREPAEPRDCDPRRERAQAYLPVSIAIQPEAEQTIELDQALEPEPQPDAQVEGWVVNASSGEPVPGAMLRFANEETHEWGSAETGENGSFQIPVNEGYYTVRVHAEGYYGNATNLRVDADGTRTTIELTPGQATDRGCCYHPPVEDAVARDSGASDEAYETGDGGDDAAQAPPPSTSTDGEEVFAGGPGELGPPPSTMSEGTTDPLQAVPAVGGLLVASLLGGVAVAHATRHRLG